MAAEADEVLRDQLPAEVHDRAILYQQDGETLSETLDRLFEAFVPHVNDVPDSLLPNVENHALAVGRMKNEDGLMTKRVYTHEYDLAKKYAEMGVFDESPSGTLGPIETTQTLAGTGAVVEYMKENHPEKVEELMQRDQ